MAKGRSKKNLAVRTQFIQRELESRYKKLTKSIQAAKDGSLDLEGLKTLKGALEKPVQLSETLIIQIEDCHPSTGPYKHALPKGYQSDITAVNEAIIQAQSFLSTEIENEIRERQREIIETFNRKPKEGIEQIKKICTKHHSKELFAKQIASFFHKQKLNLDLEAVGRYLGGSGEENQSVLNAFTAQVDLANQSFIQDFRSFLKTFKLPGEAQQIDKIVESFGRVYYQKNPGGNIASKNAAYYLAFQTIMLNTDLHNPNIAANNKMSLEGLKKNLRGLNDGANFDEELLKSIYDDIKANPFELNFVKINPGYSIISHSLNHDATFDNLDSLLRADTSISVKDIFPRIDNNIKATVDKPKSWLNFLTGYEGTVTLTDTTTQKELAFIQVYKPNVFSKWLFGEQPKVIIQPASQDGSAAQEAINLAAKIAAGFQSSLTSIKATYDYLQADLRSAYSDNRGEPKNNLTNHHNLWEKSERQPQKADPDSGESFESGKNSPKK